MSCGSDRVMITSFRSKTKPIEWFPMHLLSIAKRITSQVDIPWSAIFLAVVAAVASGIGTSGLMAIFHILLKGGHSSDVTHAWSFVLLCMFVPVIRVGFDALLVHLVYDASSGLWMHLSGKLLSTPLRRLEDIGPANQMVVLTQDVATIAKSLRTFPNFLMDTTIVVGSLIYLGYLCWQAMPIALGFLCLGILSNQRIRQRAFRFKRLAREGQDNLFRQFRKVTEGIKELKLHARRRRAFLSQVLQPTASSLKRYNVIKNIYDSITENWTLLLFFGFLSTFILVMLSLELTDSHIVTGYALVSLYMMPHVGRIVVLFNELDQVDIALNKVETTFECSEVILPREDDQISSVGANWKCLELEDVTHNYGGERGESGFMLGPLNLTFCPGELVFVSGENGSGKTTLAKLLVGLYIPENGRIRLGGQEINDENRESYRQFFSVVFADFCLFDSLLGLNKLELDAEARDFLRRLRLDHKVSVEDGTLSTTALSQGQRKRLALLTAYLEDRPFYIFDEWAADQDPVFQEIFYRQVLLELRGRGKTVLVISHDDRNYHLGDRLIKLESGKVDIDSRVPESGDARGIRVAG